MVIAVDSASNVAQSGWSLFAWVYQCGREYSRSGALEMVKGYALEIWRGMREHCAEELRQKAGDEPGGAREGQSDPSLSIISSWQQTESQLIRVQVRLRKSNAKPRLLPC